MSCGFFFSFVQWIQLTPILEKTKRNWYVVCKDYNHAMITLTITMKGKMKEIGFAVECMVSWEKPPISLIIYVSQAAVYFWIMLFIGQGLFPITFSHGPLQHRLQFCWISSLWNRKLDEQRSSPNCISSILKRQCFRCMLTSELEYL